MAESENPSTESEKHAFPYSQLLVGDKEQLEELAEVGLYDLTLDEVRADSKLYSAAYKTSVLGSRRKLVKEKRVRYRALIN